jgi:xanthine dehydrogenase YagS FAD-binding subunit
MHSFEFTRPKNAAEAIHLAGYAKTAQQSADVRFVAGGTTLIDLMKLEVENAGAAARHQSSAIRQDRRRA